MLLDILCCALLLGVGDKTPAAATESDAPAATVSHCPCGARSACTKGDHEAASACAAQSACPGCALTATAFEVATDAREASPSKKYCDECTCGEPGDCHCEKCDADCEADCECQKGEVVPASAVMPQNHADNEELTLLQQKLAERDVLQREIDELCAATRSWQQIVVRVKVMELNLTKMRAQGIDFASAEAPFKQGDARAFWDSLEKQNLAKVLAEPTVMTISGRPASFNVGGELPIPSGQGAATACDFVHFGTHLDVAAMALGDNKVRLEVRPKISSPRDDKSLVVNGNKIPSLNVTECDTACEVKFGETAVLTGLVERRTESVKTEKGVREDVQEIMLLVVVTPETPTSEATTPHMAKLSKAE